MILWDSLELFGFFWGISKDPRSRFPNFRDSMGFDSNFKDSFRILSKILWHSWQFVQILTKYSRFYGIVRDFSLFFGILEGLLKDFLKFGLKFDGYGMVLDGFGWFWMVLDGFGITSHRLSRRRTEETVRKRGKESKIHPSVAEAAGRAPAHLPIRPTRNSNNS